MRNGDRLGAERDAAGLEPLAEGLAQCLERLLEQSLVFRLAGLEPRPLVVRAQLEQELDGIRLEAGEALIGQSLIGQ